MSRYFTDHTWHFLRGLARHNERPWFQAHRDEFLEHVRTPFQRLLEDLQPTLAGISPHLRADPAPVGGSLYRIHRDTRFANDKSPYKPWQGAWLFHERRRLQPCPGFYIHLQPGACFVAGGIWHPELPIQRRIRQFIVDNPAAWERAVHAPAFERRYALMDENRLVRVPPGYPEDFPWREDLRNRSFVASRPLQDATMTGPRLLPVLRKDLQALAPLVDYLCAALELPF